MSSSKPDETPATDASKDGEQTNTPETGAPAGGEDKPSDTPKKTPKAKEVPRDPSLDAGNSANVGVNREDSLKAASQASPHADHAGLKGGQKVMGSEGQSNEDRLDASRREALHNDAADKKRTNG